MAIDRDTDYLVSILQELRTFPIETEWVEFKHNKHNPEEIGEYISALSNSAVLLNKTTAILSGELIMKPKYCRNEFQTKHREKREMKS